MDSIRAWGHPYVQFCGNRIRSRANAVRALEYPYDKWCRALWGPVRPASARSGYNYYVKHDYVTFAPLGPGIILTGLIWARNRWEPMFENCTCSTFSRGIYDTIKILRNIVRTRNACRVISQTRWCRQTQQKMLFMHKRRYRRRVSFCFHMSALSGITFTVTSIYQGITIVIRVCLNLFSCRFKWKYFKMFVSIHHISFRS